MKKTVIILLAIFFLFGCEYKEDKDYIIYHIDDFIQIDSVSFSIIIPDHSYYEEVDVNLHEDSSYQVIFWGDRDSWKWNLKLDTYFYIDVPYNRYKGCDVERDVLILNLFHNYQFKQIK